VVTRQSLWQPKSPSRPPWYVSDISQFQPPHFIIFSLPKLTKHAHSQQGLITLELYTNHAPKTCTNFTTLVQRGYYNDTPFHRIIPSFMIQGGDPTGTGRGGESSWGGTFADEIHPGLRHTGAGVLSMANAGKDTNGSQFFVTLAPTPWLDGKHAVFGRVKNGMKVIRRMGLVRTGPDDKPVEEVGIVKAWVLEKKDGEEDDAA
jgi:peptidyl-prolyl cis-trans isomerase-like 1